MTEVWMVEAADLDEFGITVELDGERIRLVTPPDPAFHDVMTSIVAVGQALGYDKPMPLYCTNRFREWVLENELAGVGFDRALGADVWELDLTTSPNDLFSPKGGMLWCNGKTRALLEQRPDFQLGFMAPP